MEINFIGEIYIHTFLWVTVLPTKTTKDLFFSFRTSFVQLRLASHIWFPVQTHFVIQFNGKVCPDHTTNLRYALFYSKQNHN